MRISTDGIVIREFERKDAEALHRIIHERDILRFMADWAENNPTPQDLYPFIERMQSRRDSTDVYQNKRYAIALAETDQLIGMVGMGLEDTLGEVEVAYFLAEAHQGKGYARRAVEALVQWCFCISEIPYLILTIDSANVPSCKLAEACGFSLFEKRTPIDHKQPNMISDSYYYYRRYRK